VKRQRADADVDEADHFQLLAVRLVVRLQVKSAMRWRDISHPPSLRI
jgi:hypothetical protein